MTTYIDPDGDGTGHVAGVPSRRRIPLGEDECLRLLGSIRLGRIVFTSNALPVIRPVNHALVDSRIIIRTHEGAALLAATSLGMDDGVVVAYEADMIDPNEHTGWSVIATGRARLVTDPQDINTAQRLLTPWIDETMERVVAIRPELITGFLLK